MSTDETQIVFENAGFAAAGFGFSAVAKCILSVSICVSSVAEITLLWLSRVQLGAPGGAGNTRQKFLGEK